MKKEIVLITLILLFNVCVFSQNKHKSPVHTKQQATRPTARETSDWIINKLYKYILTIQSPVPYQEANSERWDYGMLADHSNESPSSKNSYKFSDERYGGYKDLSITITNGKLLFNYAVNCTDFNANQIESNGIKHFIKGNMTIIIPICDIEVDTLFSQHYHNIDDEFIQVRITSIHKIFKLIKYASDGSSEEVNKDYLDNGFAIDVEFDKEDNLRERFKKAFENLQYYNPKPKNSEAF